MAWLLSTETDPATIGSGGLTIQSMRCAVAIEVGGRQTMTLFTRCLVLVILAAYGGEQGVAQSAPPAQGSQSPFDVCARVFTDDRAGESLGVMNASALATLAPYLHKALRLPDDASLPPGEIVWRCMDGNVYVCARGANIPCDSKADRSRFNRGAVNYCRENPNAPEVPAYATGHRTVYLWKCVSGQAERGRAVSTTDRRGFRADIWYLIER